MSVLPNQSQINPGTSLFYGPNGFPQIYSSTFTFGAGTGLAVGCSNYSTITVPGMVSTSGIALTYEALGGGGASQFITTITPGTNSLKVIFGANTSNTDSFNLIAVNPS